MTARLVAETVSAPESAPGGGGTPPRLVDACRKVLLTRIAQGRGRASVFDHDRAVAAFRSPVRALNAALRIQYDLASLNESLAPDKRRLYRIGVGLYGAEALCVRAAAGGICADDAVRAAAAGRLDFESTDLGPPAPGAEGRMYAIAGRPRGRIFRYRPWTTPGRRRASLVLAGALIAALLTVLATAPPGPPPG